MFAAGGCFACHRFANEGGMTGPDLTGSGGRYSPRDLLEQIINPSSEINEQFVPIIVNLKNGQSMSGVVVNMNGDRVTLNTDMFNPNQRVSVQRPQVASIEPSKVSPMPPGLLNLMREDEVMDLLAYILSGEMRSMKCSISRQQPTARSEKRVTVSMEMCKRAHLDAKPRQPA